jgi:hypothetical protein
VILVDTSVWSLALRRDRVGASREADEAVSRHFPLRLA